VDAIRFERWRGGSHEPHERRAPVETTGISVPVEPIARSPARVRTLRRRRNVRSAEDEWFATRMRASR
jgi:hypothetical protein